MTNDELRKENQQLIMENENLRTMLKEYIPKRRVRRVFNDLKKLLGDDDTIQEQETEQIAQIVYCDDETLVTYSNKSIKSEPKDIEYIKEAIKWSYHAIDSYKNHGTLLLTDYDMINIKWLLKAAELYTNNK